MTKQEATDLLPVARARVLEAYEAFAAAESELSAARAHHDFLVCTARGFRKPTLKPYRSSLLASARSWLTW